MIALLADIHGNREAMTACLADAERKAAERYVFLGDLVGYGADPGWVTDRAMDYVARGAIAILGNHDAERRPLHGPAASSMPHSATSSKNCR
jgi:predicted phosphodiesterase